MGQEEKCKFQSNHHTLLPFIGMSHHFQKHLFLELNTDSVSLFKEDGVAPKLIPEGGELVETPLSERPQSQLGLTHCPRH